MKKTLFTIYIQGIIVHTVTHLFKLYKKMKKKCLFITSNAFSLVIISWLSVERGQVKFSRQKHVQPPCLSPDRPVPGSCPVWSGQTCQGGASGTIHCPAQGRSHAGISPPPPRSAHWWTASHSVHPHQCRWKMIRWKQQPHRHGHKINLAWTKMQITPKREEMTCHNWRDLLDFGYLRARLSQRVN